MDRKLPKPTKFHNTAFKMFLEQDCDSSEGKNPLPPSQPNRRRLVFRNQTFLFFFSKRLDGNMIKIGLPFTDIDFLTESSLATQVLEIKRRMIQGSNV